MRGLLYQLQLAARDVRRNRNLSLGVVFCLALGTGLWNTAVESYLRLYGPTPTMSPWLHQVELPHRTTLERSLDRSLAQFAKLIGPTEVTFPEYQALAASAVPTRQTGALRSHLLVGDPDARGGANTPHVIAARFVDADFHEMFPTPLRAGRFFSGAEAARAEPVVVIAAHVARALWGRPGGVGRTLIIEGQRFSVVGETARDQPYRPIWDVAAMGADQDGIYLPMAWFQRLLARPDAPVYQSPVGPAFDELLRSDAIFVAYWNELPTEAQRAAYQRHLDQRFGQRGIKPRLRSLSAWTAAFPVPDSGVRFLAMLTGLVLIGACCNITRLLLAKALARRAELGIHRALGAPRFSLFARQIFEGGLLALPAALLGIALALPVHAVFNHLVADSDIPLRVTGLGFVASAGPALLTGIAAALFPAWRVSLTPPTLERSKI